MLSLVRPSRFHSLWLLVAAFLFAAAPGAVSGTVINGREHLSLNEIAGALGMDTRWISSGKTLELRSQWTRMVFTVHQRDIELNGVKVHLGDPVAKKGSRLYISRIDYERTIQSILTPQVFSDPPKLYRIVIDPGHGGKDPGAQNKSLRLQEKNLTLDVARRLEKRLAAMGYQVVLTRTRDDFVELTERARKANAAQADLFVSLHFNAASSAQVEGIETFVFTPRDQPSTSRGSLHSSDRRDYAANRNDVWNALIGYYIQRELSKNLPTRDRGLKRARFTVLRDLNMPGLLIEGGFVSHSREGRNVGSAAYRQQIADAIADGIFTYQKTLNRLRN